MVYKYTGREREKSEMDTRLGEGESDVKPVHASACHSAKLTANADLKFQIQTKRYVALEIDFTLPIQWSANRYGTEDR